MADISIEEQKALPSVGVHTKQILNSCINKDCIEELRVFLPTDAQTALDSAAGARARYCELLYAYIDVEAMPYNRGHYTVDTTFYYNIIGETTVPGNRPTPFNGLSVFSKRVVLCGGEGNTRVFSNRREELKAEDLLPRPQPDAVLEVLDPMILSAKVIDVQEGTRPDPLPAEIPAAILDYYGGTLVMSDEQKRLYVSIGQFSTVRLERDAQLMLTNARPCIPDKECCDDPGCVEEPCELFSRIDFPTEAFFPENRCES